MKYLLIPILIISLNCYGQDYKSSIADFRKKYTEDFLTGPGSPLTKGDLQYLRFYDADSAYRVIAKAEILINPPVFIMATYTSGGQQYTRYAVLKFELKGKPVQLTMYKSVALGKLPQYSDYLFIPFTDETNGKTTYGGGRYIDMRTGDIKNNTVVIDFNKAYNPYCAFGGNYACPKPPDENSLQLAVEAGEKLYAGEKKH